MWYRLEEFWWQPLSNLTDISFKDVEGCIETMLLLQRRFPLLPYHINRCQKALTHYSLPLDASHLFDCVVDFLNNDSNNYPNAKIRLIICVSGQAHDVFMQIEALDITQWRAFELDAIELAPSVVVPNSLPFKGLNRAWLQNVIAYKNTLNAWDVLIQDKEGRIVEGCISNIFAFQGDTLLTPEENSCVPGVMRAWILEEASKAGYTIVKRSFDKAFLLDCDEIFLSNAVYGIVPVHSFKKKYLKTFKTRALIDCFYHHQSLFL